MGTFLLMFLVLWIASTILVGLTFLALYHLGLLRDYFGLAPDHWTPF